MATSQAAPCHIYAPYLSVLLNSALMLSESSLKAQKIPECIILAKSDLVKRLCGGVDAVSRFMNLAHATVKLRIGHSFAVADVLNLASNPDEDQNAGLMIFLQHLMGPEEEFLPRHLQTLDIHFISCMTSIPWVGGLVQFLKEKYCFEPLVTDRHSWILAR